MKKILALLLGLTMALSLAACSGEPIATGEPEPTGGAQIPNPMVQQDNAEALKAAGVAIDAPEGAQNVVYYIIDGTLAQVNFTLDGKDYSYRASASESEISGVYGSYKEAFTMYLTRDADNLTATASTGEQGDSLVEWEAEGVSYSLYCASGVEEQALRECVKGCMARTFVNVQDAVQESDGVVELMQDATLTMDLNGDGVNETVTFEVIPEQDTTLARLKLKVSSDNGASDEAVTDIQYMSRGYAYDADKDGFVELFISGDVCSCDFSTWAFRFDGEKLVPAKAIYEDYGDEGICSPGAEGSVAGIDAQSGVITVSRSVDIIGTWGCFTQYRIAEGEFALEQVPGAVWARYTEYDSSASEYWEYATLTTVKELPYTPDGSGEQAVLPVGEKLALIDTDGETFFHFETQSGIKGVITTQRLTGDMEWGFNINGEKEDTYFEMVPYAG